MQNLTPVLKDVNMTRGVMMKNNLVGIGEIKILEGATSELKVVALGSCVAVVFYAKEIQTIGVAHVALPESEISELKSPKPAGYFADTAIDRLVMLFKELGVTNKRDISIKLVGGASIMDPKRTFDIGKRNVLALRKYLWKHGLGALAEDVGKNYSRTIKIKGGSNEVEVSSPYKGSWTL